MKNYLLILFSIFTTLLCHAQKPIFWGYTFQGGQYGDGIIFNYNVATEMDEHNFAGSPNDGQFPHSMFTKASNGLLYGLTYVGGVYSNGTIFSYNISTGLETDLHDFGKGTDGEKPLGALIQASNGLLYGMTGNGGAYGQGTLFSYNISTGIETDLFDLDITNGSLPTGSLIQANNGLLYGLIGNGGVYGEGLIFSYNISNNTFTVLHDFGSGTDGKLPLGSLIQANNGLLYGMTQIGGTNDTTIDGGGIIFSYNITTSTETVLHNFGSGVDGREPFYGNLIQVGDSLLFGMTRDGGNNDTSRGGDGVIFSYDITTDIETILYNFGSGTDGKSPAASLIQASDGSLYGMTELGGVNSNGIIFNYNIATGTESDIHDFGNGTDGKYPWGSLIEVDTATISVAPIASICKGGSVTLKASGATTYAWAPATALSATTGDSVIASPTVTTTYTITGVGVNPATVIVTVNSGPIISVNTPMPVCSGVSDTLIANGGTSYTWSPSTALNATTGDSVIANPTATTVYLITANTNGCTATATDTVNIISAPPLTIIPPSAIMCTGLSATLMVSGGGSGFVWSPSAGLNDSTGSSVIATPSVTTTYTVTGMDSMGCTATGTSVVTILPSPNQPTFTQKGDTLISSSQHDNQWYYNGNPLNGDTSQRLIITVPGYYWVVVNNEVNGCSTASDSMKVDTVTGIEQLIVESGQFTVYPNPTTGEINIVSTTIIDDFKITDVLGELVYESNPKQNKFNFELKSEGMYFVTITSDNETETKRIVVIK